MAYVILHSLENANQNQRKFADNAIHRLETIVNDNNFIQKVTTGQYSRRRYYTDAGTYVEADNNTIWNIISGGKERLTQPDNKIDVEAKLARLGRTTVGGVTPPSSL